MVLGFTGIFLVTYFNPLRMLAKLPINVGDLVVSGTKITMEQPRLSGFTRDERAYELSADAAKQDLTKPDLIELRNIRAKVQMQDKSTVEMSATAGIYDSKAETLKLDQNILLSSSAGYRGELSEALIDIRKGYVVSEHPVAVEMLQGKLNASRLEIVDSGDLVRFDGGVSMTLMLTRCHGIANQSRNEMIALRIPLLIAAAMLVMAGAPLGAQPLERAAERAAGLCAEPRSAGAYRSGHAGSARQGQGGDLQRRCKSAAGRHRPALQVAGGVL